LGTKETPLINAVDKLGALPGFLFANMFVTGVFSMVMCAVFGAFAVGFYTLGHGASQAAELAAYATMGAVAGLVAGCLFNIVVLFGAGAIETQGEHEEAHDRRRFVMGSFTGAVFTFLLLIALWHFFGDALRDMDPIVGDRRHY